MGPLKEGPLAGLEIFLKIAEHERARARGLFEHSRARASPSTDFLRMASAQARARPSTGTFRARLSTREPENGVFEIS